MPGAFKATVEHPFPEPELQKNPQVDLQNFERDQRATLSGYGWVDRPKGIVRIPIEQAMRIDRSPRTRTPMTRPTSLSYAATRRRGRSPTMRRAFTCCSR